MSNASTMTCPLCDGRGSGVAPDDQDEFCDRCNGTGRVAQSGPSAPSACGECQRGGTCVYVVTDTGKACK